MVELAQLVEMVKQNYLARSISDNVKFFTSFGFYDLHIIIVLVKEFLWRDIKISTLYRVGKGDLSCLHYHGIIPCCYQLACKLSITWN